VPRARDEKERPPCIPKSVIEESEEIQDAEMSKQARAMLQLQKSLEEEQDHAGMWERGEVPGMNSKLWRERWQLANPEWKFDIIPEIIDGKTIYDFIDPEIEKKLEELEREENERVQQLEDEEAMKSSESEIDEETMEIIHKIRQKKKMLNLQHKTKISIEGDEDQSRMPRERKTRTVDKLESHLTNMGLSEEQVKESVDRVRSRSREQSHPRQGRKRTRSESRPRDEEEKLDDKTLRKRTKSRERSVSATPKPGSGYKDFRQVEKAAKINKRLMVARGHLAKKGEADRSIPNLMPKHLNSGKMSMGKRQRR